METPSVVLILRMQAWERAKGELMGLLQTYFSENDRDRGKYSAVKKTIEDFIKYFEDYYC